MTHLKDRTGCNEEKIIAYQLVYKVPIANAVSALRQMKTAEDANKDNPAVLLMDISHYVDNDILVFTVIEEWKSIEDMFASGSKPDLQFHFEYMTKLSCVPLSARILRGPQMDFPLPDFYAYHNNPQ